METTPELEKFISQLNQKIQRMMAVEFELYQLVKLNVGIGQGQIELTISFVDKKLLEKKKIMHPRGALGTPPGQA